MKKIFLSMCALVFLCSNAWAGNAYVLPIIATQKANAVLLTNPPLPQSYNEKGTHKISIMPAYIKGSGDVVDHSESGDFKQVEDYKGLGGAAAVSWAFTDHWALWGFAFGTNLNKGTFSYNSLGAGDQESISNFSATVFSLAGGLSWQFKGETPTDTTLTMFFGPSVMKADVKESYLSKNGPGGATIYDLDLSSSPLFLGFAFGAMASIPVYENWKFEPFAMISHTFGAYHDYKVDTIRTNNPVGGGGTNNALTGTGCADNNAPVTTPHEIHYDTNTYAIGLNVKYKPWDLAVNITAPFFQKATSTKDRGDSMEVSDVAVFSITKSFGDYKQ